MNKLRFDSKKISKVFNGKFLLMLPFLLISLILVIIPTIIIVIYAFVPHDNLGEAANWEVMDLTTWQIIGWTLLTSVITTAICIIIGFPFAYWLSLSKSKIFRVFALLVITSPIWTSTLFKLIGLKTMFDILNGAINSTYGDQYTILGYVYIFLPLMILPIYQVLEVMPANYSLASQDLGASKARTFFMVVLPYAKKAILAGITLVFVPSMMIISVTAYMNNASNAQLLGGEIYSQASLGLDNKLSLSRASVISIVSAMILLALWFACVKVPKWIVWCIRTWQLKGKAGKYYAYSSNVLNSKKKKHSVNAKLGGKRIIFPSDLAQIDKIIKNIHHIYVVTDFNLDDNTLRNSNQTHLDIISLFIHLNNATDVLGKDDIALKE